MSRLPKPGGDNGKWGNILNEFLLHQHNSDGSHALTAADIGLGNVTNDQQLKASALDTDPTLAADSDSRVASQKAIKTYTSTLAPNATNTTPGKVQLTGDLGGTAENPAVKRTARFIVAPHGDSRPADYTCAGATNNQIEINQAIAAAHAIPGGGVVELLDGSFTVDGSIVPRNNVWLRGQGMYATKLGITSDANANIIGNRTVYNKNNPWKNGIISDLEIDGSGLNTTSTVGKGIDGVGVVNCKIMRIYCHDTVATGIGLDDFQAGTITECIITGCGYNNKHVITAALWASSTITFTTQDTHNYTVGDNIIVTGMRPITYNGRFNITSVVDGQTFTVGTSNNPDALNLTTNPGTATAFGLTSDDLIGHNGIGIASGALATESVTVTNNFCFGNQNNNFLIEINEKLTTEDDPASFVFSNNVSTFAGSCGFRNTGTINTLFNNNFDYGSPIGVWLFPFQGVKSITAASWSGSVATFTTSAAHGWVAGQETTLAGMSPTSWNGFFRIAATPSSTTFTVHIAINPGTATAFGTATTIQNPVYGTQVINNIFSHNQSYGIYTSSEANGLIIKNNTIKYSYNYGILSNSSYVQFSDNQIYNCGRDGIKLVNGSYSQNTHIGISGNLIYNNSQKQANNWDGINVDSGVTSAIQHLIIQANHVFDDQATKTQRFGVLLRGGGLLNDIHVHNNDLANNLTRNLYLQDTADTIYAHNNGGANPIGKKDLGSINGNVTFDAKLGDHMIATLTGNITAVLPDGMVVGQTMRLALAQDATGSRTVTWPSNFKKAGGNLTLSTTANTRDIITACWDGTNWLEVGRSMGVT